MQRHNNGREFTREQDLKIESKLKYKKRKR